MPNDMSPCPAEPENLSHPLLARADRFVRRAHALADTVGLTQTDATAALDHLATMQADLARMRRLQSQEADAATRPFRAAEAAMLTARAAMSEALLHAVPDPSKDPIGLVPHGTAPRHGISVRPASICRATLDLEALRPFLSDAALQDAVAAQSRATGRADLVGVTYAALPDSAHLDGIVH